MLISRKTPATLQQKSDTEIHSQEFYTVQEAAYLLNKSEDTIRRYCESGKIVAIRGRFGTKTTYKIPNTALAYYRHNEDKKRTFREPKKPKFLGKEREENYLEGFREACLHGDMSEKGIEFSENTANSYVYHLKRFFAEHKELSYLNLQLYLKTFGKTQYASKEKVHRSALCFAKYLCKIRMAEYSLVEDIRSLKVPSKSKDKLAEGRRQKTLSEDDLLAIYKSCAKKVKDRLLITLLSNTGVRASEYADIKISDINLEKRILVIRKGKGFGGGKTRRVPLTNYLITVISEYLATVTKNPDDYLQVNRKGKKLDKNGVYQRVQRIGEEAGVNNASPHGIRRAFVTINANKGRPLHILQQMCGHEDIQTTMLYVNATEEEMINEVSGW